MTAVKEERPAQAPPARPPVLWALASPWLQLAWRYGLLVVLGALIVYFAASEPAFGTYRNGMVILQSVAIVAVVALGVTASLVVGGFDLSIGSNV
ncbi:MAG: ABC transporter permease, partial [Actinomycetota bacterium]|nr:ABC transporter permease [Actinomycetota bacterium]